MEQYASMADEELAMSYMKGDNKAFDVLLDRHKTKLFTYIMFVVRDEDFANDIFQDTFVKVITKMHEGHYNTSGKFGYWLTKVCHNIIMDQYRRQKSECITELGADNDIESINDDDCLSRSHEERIVKAQVLDELKMMINRLPPEQREVIYMRFHKDMSFKEIANLTGVSINTALGRVRYAVRNLRRMARKMDVVIEDFNCD